MKAAGAPVIDRMVAVNPRWIRRLGWCSLVEHRILKMRYFLGSLLVTGICSPFIYLLGLGAGLGVLVDRGRGVGDVAYLTFLAPALVMATAMQVSCQENTYGVFGGFKWDHTFTAMRLTPVTPAQMALGFQVSVLARVMPMLVFYLVALWMFGIADPLGLVLLLPVGGLLSVATGFATMAWIATQDEDRGQLSVAERFVVVPLMLFSGTYFPLETLPAYLQPVGWVSPLWHASQLGRAALYGAPVGLGMVAVHTGFLVLVALVCAVPSVRAFRRRLDQ